MVRSLITVHHLAPVLMAWVLGACTINIYHAPPATSAAAPVSSAESLLTIPPAPVASTATQSAEPVLAMQVTGGQGDQRVQYLDSVELSVRLKVDAYLNCYYQQANGNIIKVFPNRYRTRYWVYAGQSVTLPESERFQIVADSAGATEGFMCLASSEDILIKLPLEYRTNVFQKLPSQNFDAMYALYRQASQENLVGRVISYDIQ